MWGETLERSAGLTLKQKGKGVGKRIEYSAGLRKFGPAVGSTGTKTDIKESCVRQEWPGSYNGHALYWLETSQEEGWPQ